MTTKKPAVTHAKPKPKPTPKPKPAATAGPAPVVTAVPVAAAASSEGGDLARTLLLALAILFIALAALPWRRVFDTYVAPDRVVRVRVAFVMVGLSVGFGYVIATYLNGVT